MPRITIEIDVDEAIPGAIGRDLTRSQRAIFQTLKAAHGRIVTHASLWDALYVCKPSCDYNDSNIIKVHISKIRRRVPGWKIVNHFGIGYSMTARVQ